MVRPIIVIALTSTLLAVGVTLAVVLSLRATNDRAQDGDLLPVGTQLPQQSPELFASPDAPPEIVIAVTPAVTPTGGVIIVAEPATDTPQPPVATPPDVETDVILPQLPDPAASPTVLPDAPPVVETPPVAPDPTPTLPTLPTLTPPSLPVVPSREAPAPQLTPPSLPEVAETAGPRSPADDDTHVQTPEHVAHAVPGRAYEQPDLDGDGIEIVELDASRSHSHFYEAGPPSELGRIVSWIWFDPETEDVLAESSTPFLQFGLGLTRVGLRVRDNFGNENVDYTNVTITPSSVAGAFCYFYDTPGETGFILDTNVVVGVKPLNGTLVESIDYSSIDDFPEAFRNKTFQTRCMFHSEGGSDATFTIAHDGPMRVLVSSNGDAPIVLADVTSAGSENTSVTYAMPAGRNSFQIWYLQIAETPAQLFVLESPAQEHELSQQLPLISYIDPPNSTLAGGGVLNVFGTGLWNAPNVYFDGEILPPPDAERSTTSLLSVVVPPSDVEKTVEVTVGNRFGGSNGVPFVYDDSGLPPIKFRETRVQKDDMIFKIPFITNLQYGPDGRLYLASLDSFVYSVVISRQLVASDVCKSPSLGNSRTVIGLAFNPADTEVKLYASSSIFFWQMQDVTGDFPWANGRVSVLKPNYEGACLGIVGDPIITGLPVSNHDHGVNGLLFDDDGLLHIQVGGATNAGVNALNIGGISESPLSAASLIADVNKPGFNGNMVYDDTDPGVARIIQGDVEVFSPGWRNSFDLCMHSNGMMYATDNGANAEFGNRSISCTEEGLISPYHSDDKLAKLIEGKYGGHANRNRGRDDPIQCRWRSPEDPPTDNYNPPIATLQSSTDGIIEYTADLFSGRMKGDLILSKYSTNDPNDEGRVYRVRLDGNGDREGPVNTLWDASGLSLEMSPWGDLLMGRLYDFEIMVLQAEYETPKVGSLIAVTPFRGPVGGGNVVLVTGYQLGRSATALFAGNPCTAVEEIDEDQFRCTVPAGLAGSVRVSIRLADGRVVKSSRGYDYRYMRI